jgi:hypothetical protein
MERCRYMAKAVPSPAVGDVFAGMADEYEAEIRRRELERINAEMMDAAH